MQLMTNFWSALFPMTIVRSMKWLILGVAAFLATKAVADDLAAAKRRFLPVDEAGKWSGVGRLNAKGGFCTAALIGPDTLLTAAHCIFDRATNRPIPLREMHFVAGSRKGYHTANRRVVFARAHPDWSGYHGEGVRVSGDIAVVKLESPVTRIEGRSYVVGVSPDEGDDVVLLSFGRDRADALSIQEPCQVIDRYQRTASLNCDVTYGASGSPVFENGRIVGVISAMSVGEGRKLAFAVLVDGAIQDLIEQSPETSSEKPQIAKRAGSGFKAAPTGASRLPGGKRPPKP